MDRNAFGLKAPPPPQDPNQTPVTPPPSAAKVVLTGITSLFGPDSKRALLEIEEPEPGKAKSIRKPILREGEKDGAVEVLAIDIENNIVRIRNAGVEAELTFEVPKSGPAAPAPVAHALKTAAAPGPIIVSQSSHATGGGGVVLTGGAQQDPVAANQSSVTATGLGALNASRPLRSDTAATRPSVSREEAWAIMEKMRADLQAAPPLGNRPPPPLPPTPFTQILEAERQAEANQPPPQLPNSHPGQFPPGFPPLPGFPR